MQNVLCIVGTTPAVKKEKLLLDPSDTQLMAHKVITSPSPTDFQAAQSAAGFRILTILAKGPSYPAQIAKQIGTYHQTVYYHIHALEQAGLVKKVREQKIRGGMANLYEISSDGFAVEYGRGGEALPSAYAVSRPSVLSRFFGEFFVQGDLNGWIVVGSPEPHGASRTQGRDGHYAVQLGFALGQHVRLPTRFPVKLDVDLKNERLEKSNLILVGGPRTNIVSAELNPHLPIKFQEGSFWGSLLDNTGRSYHSELDAIIAKVTNPWDSSSVCVVAAGLTAAGTKAAVIGLTNFSDKILKGYRSGEFACVVRGMDFDGDGKVDSAELVHRAPD
jgi:DNA-binding transcriptional ArsR family regulator